MKPAGSFAAAIFTAIASALAAAGGVVLLAGCTSCQTTVRTATMPVIAAGTFDVLEADQTSHRLYLADRTSKGVDVVDISSATPRFLSTIKLDGAPNGLALAPDRHRLYAAVAGGTVAVIDTEASSPKSMQVIESIKVHTANADLLDYSPMTPRPTASWSPRRTAALIVRLGFSAGVVSSSARWPRRQRRMRPPLTLFTALSTRPAQRAS